MKSRSSRQWRIYSYCLDNSYNCWWEYTLRSTLGFSSTQLLLSAMAISQVILPAFSEIGCFVCYSFNGSNPQCEDPFNSAVNRTPSIVGAQRKASIPAAGMDGGDGSVPPTSDSLSKHGTTAGSPYQFPCWTAKKNRRGLFPADHCVKVSGYQTSDSRHTLVIRTCALDSGTLTADTEIVRSSHCGHFSYDGRGYTGCVQACDTDGCNGSSDRRSISSLNLSVLGLMTAADHCDRGGNFELRETFKVAPDRLYEILTSKELVQAWAGGGGGGSKAMIDAREGGGFALFNWHLCGRFVKLVESKEIEAKFRLASYPEDLYANVRFVLVDQADSTELVIEVDGVPEKQVEATKQGFSRYYLHNIGRTFGICGGRMMKELFFA